jgi:flagellar basal-body rod modification protein FlgD
MSQVSPTANAPNGSNSNSRSNALNNLDLDAFLNLMIVELQNQDPLNPLENDQLLAQISQIREVGATDRLTETLDSVLLGQNISSATSLIGADVIALTESGERVTGNVRRVSIDGGEPKLDLAVGPVALAGADEGQVGEGKYKYEVVWDGPEGTPFSFEVDVDTETLANFNGSIQVANLPETTGAKRIYRTDGTGTGERRLVGTVTDGKASTFTDAKASSERGAVLSGQPQQLSVARRVTVTLNNIAQIEPPTQ